VNLIVSAAHSVLVVGGGPSGLATAALLAARGCSVVVLESLPTVGGAAGRLGDHGWDAGATAIFWPEVFCDLFEQTGTALEKQVDLRRLPSVRQHLFTDGSRISLEDGIDLGSRWTAHLNAYGEVWDQLGGDFFRCIEAAHVSSRAAEQLINSRKTLHQALRSGLPDEHLRSVAAHPYLRDGHNLRSVPIWGGVSTYLEVDGMWSLTAALERRCTELGVRVHTDSRVFDLLVENGRVRGARSEEGDVLADAVVLAMDPRALPSIRPLLPDAVPIAPPHVLYLAVRNARPLPAETVVHGSHPLVVRASSPADPDEGEVATWSVTWTDGSMEEEHVLDRLREAGFLASGATIEQQHIRQPVDQHRWWGGSPMGVRWTGTRSLGASRLRPPLAGLQLVGAHVARGPGLPFAVASAFGAADAITAYDRPKQKEEPQWLN
jgi:phytoene dehydrogenase-like protein